MPYLIYRCDLTDSLDGKPQALRFKAVLMSDKFNIQDEIDVSCALNPSTLLSPVHVDGSYFDLKSFEAKKGEELLTPQAMAGKSQNGSTIKCKKMAFTSSFFSFSSSRARVSIERFSDSIP